MKNKDTRLMPIANKLDEALRNLAELDKAYNRARHDAMVAGHDLIEHENWSAENQTDGGEQGQSMLIEVETKEAALETARGDLIEQAQNVVLLWRQFAAAKTSNEEGMK